MTTRASSRGRLSYTSSDGPVSGKALTAGQIRVGSFNKGERFAEVVGAPRRSLLELVNGHRTSVKVEEPLEVADEILDVEMIVDPPCIAPFEDEDDAAPKVTSTLEGVSPQDYWKHHTTWRTADPLLATKRHKGCEFVAAWAKKFNLEGTLKPSDQKESLNEMIKRKNLSKTRSKINASGKSGLNLDSTDGFVNISSFPIGIRKISSIAEDQKTGDVVLPGECLLVDRIQEKDHVRFLKLADGRGWVFDSFDTQQVMAKMEELEIGDMWYRVSKDLVDVRRTPVYDQEAKTGRLLCPRELVIANIKCRVRGQMFLNLADGSGWVFVSRPSTQKDKRSSGDVVMEECDAEICYGDALTQQEGTLPVTNDIVEAGSWTYQVAAPDLLALGTKLHGVALIGGEVVKIDKRCYANGQQPEPGMAEKSCKWLRIADGRGWIPDRSVDGKLVMKLQTDAMGYPQTMKDSRSNKTSAEAAQPKWVTGIA